MQTLDSEIDAFEQADAAFGTMHHAWEYVHDRFARSPDDGTAWALNILHFACANAYDAMVASADAQIRTALFPSPQKMKGSLRA